MDEGASPKTSLTVSAPARRAKRGEHNASRSNAAPQRVIWGRGMSGKLDSALSRKGRATEKKDRGASPRDARSPHRRNRTLSSLFYFREGAMSEREALKCSHCGSSRVTVRKGREPAHDPM